MPAAVAARGAEVGHKLEQPHRGADHMLVAAGRMLVEVAGAAHMVGHKAAAPGHKEVVGHRGAVPVDRTVVVAVGQTLVAVWASVVVLAQRSLAKEAQAQ